MASTAFDPLNSGACRQDKLPWMDSKSAPPMANGSRWHSDGVGLTVERTTGLKETAILSTPMSGCSPAPRVQGSLPSASAISAPCGRVKAFAETARQPSKG